MGGGSGREEARRVMPLMSVLRFMVARIGY